MTVDPRRPAPVGQPAQCFAGATFGTGTVSDDPEAYTLLATAVYTPRWLVVPAA